MKPRLSRSELELRKLTMRHSSVLKLLGQAGEHVVALKRGALAMRDLALQFGNHLADCTTHEGKSCTCGWALAFGAMKNDDKLSVVEPPEAH